METAGPLLPEDVRTLTPPLSLGTQLYSRRTMIRGSIAVLFGAGSIAGAFEVMHRIEMARRLEHRSPAAVLSAFPEGVVIGKVALQVRKADVPSSKKSLIFLEMPPLSRGPYTHSILPPQTAEGGIDGHISPELSSVLTELHTQGIETVYLDDRWWAYSGERYVSEIHCSIDTNQAKQELAEDLVESAVFSTKLQVELAATMESMRAGKRMNDMAIETNTKRAEQVLGGTALTEKVIKRAISIKALARPELYTHTEEQVPEPFAHPQYYPKQIQTFLQQCAQGDKNVIVVTRQPEMFEQQLQEFNMKHGPTFSSVTLTPQTYGKQAASQ